jgi:hypothetical protein
MPLLAVAEDTVEVAAGVTLKKDAASFKPTDAETVLAVVNGVE